MRLVGAGAVMLSKLLSSRRHRFHVPIERYFAAWARMADLHPREMVRHGERRTGRDTRQRRPRDAVNRTRDPEGVVTPRRHDGHLSALATRQYFLHETPPLGATDALDGAPAPALQGSTSAGLRGTWCQQLPDLLDKPNIRCSCRPSADLRRCSRNPLARVPTILTHEPWPAPRRSRTLGPNARQSQPKDLPAGDRRRNG